MKSPRFYLHEDGSVTWMDGGPLRWPTIEVNGRLWHEEETRKILSWYSEAYKVYDFDRLVVAWKPLVPFMRSWRWCQYHAAQAEWVLLLRPYLKVMGKLGEGNNCTSVSIRKMVWLGSWE